MIRISQFSKRVGYLLVTLLIMLPMLAAASEKPPNAITKKLYVDPDATGPEDGNSWGTAYHYLQDALDRTNANGSSLYTIWVAEGVYYPDEDSLGVYQTHLNDDQNEFFKILYDNVRLYGGFAGGESSLSERDWVNNPTILSGDIDKDDDSYGGDFINDDWSEISGDNAYHVVYLNGELNEDITTDTVIDGFIITAGDGSSASQYGGGIYCSANYGGSSGECSPELRNLIVQGNRASYGGGIRLDALYSAVSSPEISNVSLVGNRSTSEGGGMSVFCVGSPGPVCYPALVNVKFRGNYAGTHGGGFSLNVNAGTGSPTLTNVEFYDNGADSQGGGYYSTIVTNGISEQVLTNVTFHGNYAESGGGMFNQIDGTITTYSIHLNNVILWGDSATFDPEMMNDDDPVISNSDIDGCGGSASWVSSCGTNNGGNIDADPLFTNPGTGDLTLQLGSPAINAGDQTLLPVDLTDVDSDNNRSEIIEVDLAMNPRVENSNVDMGAYEYQGDTVGLYDPALSKWFLKPANVAGGDGVTKFYYGPAGGGRLPITGDWDGDGEDTVGLYDPVTSRWFLKPENIDGGAGVIKFYYGPAGGGRLPIVGDWDGDGVDTVGMYDPVTSRWFLKPNNVGGSAGVIKFYYGPAGGGRLPIVGDWDGDGVDTVGLYDPVTSRWFLKPENVDGGAGVIKFYYGPAGGGRLPISGDWDGVDGIDTIGLYDPVISRWFLKPENVDGGAGVIKFYYGPAGGGRLPIAGNW
jgi:hypothetical protein